MGREVGIRFDADKIRSELDRRGMSLRDFSEKCGWEHSQLVRLLKVGRCRSMTLDILAQALCLPVTELLPDEAAKLKVVLDPGAYMPTRAHKADAGLDLYSREDACIFQNSGGEFDTGVHVAIPEGYVGFLKSKSGLNIKHSIQSEGVIDSGYTGSIRVKLFNHGNKAVYIKEGQKISQLVLLPIITPEPVLVDHLEVTERGNGGFGSTGAF